MDIELPNLFKQAEINFFKEQNKIKQMNEPIKMLEENKKEAIRQKHWDFLSEYEAMLLPSNIFSPQEKYDLLTEMQNNVQVKIDAEIIIEETILNFKK